MSILFFMEEKEQYELLKTFEEAYDIEYHGSVREVVQSIPVPLYRRKDMRYNTVTELDLSPTMDSHIYKSFLIMHKRNYIDKTELKGISYSPGGVWQEKYLIHGEFDFDNSNVEMREPFKELRKMVRAASAKQINGYYIGKDAYTNRDKYDRFILIEVGSPKEYDLPVD